MKNQSAIPEDGINIENKAANLKLVPKKSSESKIMHKSGKARKRLSLVAITKQSSVSTLLPKSLKKSSSMAPILNAS